MTRWTPRQCTEILVGGAAAALGESGGRFRLHAHTRLIFEQLGRVMAGEIDRLLIVCPPRHGKTLAVTSMIATWLRGGAVGDLRARDVQSAPVG